MIRGEEPPLTVVHLYAQAEKKPQDVSLSWCTHKLAVHKADSMSELHSLVLCLY